MPGINLFNPFNPFNAGKPKPPHGPGDHPHHPHGPHPHPKGARPDLDSQNQDKERPPDYNEILQSTLVVDQYYWIQMRGLNFS